MWKPYMLAIACPCTSSQPRDSGERVVRLVCVAGADAGVGRRTRHERLCRHAGSDR